MKAFFVNIVLITILMGVVLPPEIATAAMLGDQSELLSSLDCGFFGTSIYQDKVKVRDSKAASDAPSMTLSRLKAYGEVGFAVQGQALGAFRVGVAQSTKLAVGGDSVNYGSGVPFVGITFAVPVFTLSESKGGFNFIADVEYTTTANREVISQTVATDNSYINVRSVSEIRNLWQAKVGVIAHGNLWQSSEKKRTLLGYGGFFYNVDSANMHNDTTVSSFTAQNVLTSSSKSSNGSTLKSTSPIGIAAGVKFNATSLWEVGSLDRWSVALETQYQGAWGGGLTVSRTF